MPTNLYTKVTVNDTEYTIKKFTARTGMQLARLIMAKLAPIIPLLDTNKKTAEEIADDGKLYATIGELLSTMTDADVDDLMQKCLSVCYVNLPAGLQPVMDETGNYGVDGLEYDLGTTLRLMVEAIKWGASDFFGENLSALLRSMK